MIERTINQRVLALCRDDITRQQVDAIVNAANTRLAGGGGVDGAIHRAGGPAIMAACRQIGSCPTGTAVITTGGRLPARYVIHTVGPVYRDGSHGEAHLLRSAYRSSLELAEQHALTTLAFPSISTGVYHYPIREAARIALETISAHLRQATHLVRVCCVLFSDHDLEIYAETLREIS